jgi:hypothetical protein
MREEEEDQEILPPKDQKFNRGFMGNGENE